MINTLKAYACQAAAAACFVVGMVVGKWLWEPVPQIADTVKQKKENSFQAETVYSPSTRTLERETGNLPSKIPKASIPGTVKRFSEIKIQPVDLQPITVQVVQSEDATGTRSTVGVIAPQTGKPAEIVTGREIVTPEKYFRPKNLHWSAHILASWDRDGKAYGAMVGYETGRLTTHIGVFPTMQTVFCGVGIKW